MKALFDTNVLIASLVRGHPHHSPCAAWLRAVKTGAVEMVVFGHTIAEIYSTLTRSRLIPGLTPAQTALLIRSDVLPQASVAVLSAVEYVQLVDELGRNGLAGGIVYDAIHAAVARAQAVDAIVTVNVPHFQRVWTGQVISPLVTAPPTP